MPGAATASVRTSSVTYPGDGVAMAWSFSTSGGG